MNNVAIKKKPCRSHQADTPNASNVDPQSTKPLDSSANAAVDNVSHPCNENENDNDHELGKLHIA